MARLRQQQSNDELRLTTESLYWKLVTLKATRCALEAAIATLDTLDNQVKVAVDAGVAMNNDLLKVQLKRNTYRTEMVDLDNGSSLPRRESTGSKSAYSPDVAHKTRNDSLTFPTKFIS